MRKITLQNILIVAVLLLCIFISLVSAYSNAAVNGSTIIKENYNSSKEKKYKNNILIIGDSRMHQLHDIGKSASYVCVWGGHYYGDVKESIPSINRTRHKNKIKAIINEIVKQKGSCRVIVEATINDYAGKGDYKDALNKLVNFAQEVAGYNKKAVVYVTSLIPAKNGNSVSKFNIDLKKKADASPNIRYINIKPDKVAYQSDGLHFAGSTLDAIYNKIKNNTYSDGSTIIKKNYNNSIEKKYKNNILIIGDSRMHQLCMNGKSASYVCVWGGSYKNKSPRINTPNNKNQIKAIIKEIVKQKGSCRVIIEATINDYASKGNYTSALNNLINFAEEVAKYNKNAVVYVTSLIPIKNGDKVNEFNKAIKKEAKDSPNIRYIDIKPNTVKYDADKIHFTAETVTGIYNKIKNGTYSK